MALIVHPTPPPEAVTHHAPSSPYRAAIAIPAKDEEALIGDCLKALAAQTWGERFAVVLVLNNCTDDTAGVVKALAPDLPFDVHLYDITLPAGKADAAWARRLSMNAAVALLDRHGVMLSTDADSLADPDWLRANVAELTSGADVVCGFVVPEPTGHFQLPVEAVRRGAMEFEFGYLVAEMNALLDPLPHDPWPHHVTETGASLAMRPAPYLDVGGIPHVQPAEDRAFVHLARRRQWRVRHALTPRVVTSCRLDGRARGGWADDLRARVENPTGPCHDALEPAGIAYRRAALRGALRKAWDMGANAEAWARRLHVPRSLMDRLMEDAGFEEGWSQLESRSPLLRKEHLCSGQLPWQTERMRRIVARLRLQAEQRAANLHDAPAEAPRVAALATER